MTASDLCLAPMSKKLSARQGVFSTAGKKYVLLVADDTQSLMPAARKAGLGLEITADPKAPKDSIGLIIRLKKDSSIPNDGYKLLISPDRVEITASTPAGAFYGACTLAQVARQCTRDGSRIANHASLPCLSISDWPDLSVRGVMLDITRDKVPTMETLYHLVDLLAEWKINQLQLYTEHAFAYLAHPTVWKDADPITGEQILDLDAYCKARFIELVPNQNSFDHMERWLKHEQYNSMAEAPNGCDTKWGFRGPSSLCPVDRRSIPFVRGLFNELLPHFSSRQFNVGLDETIDLGCVRSKKGCTERGAGRVYLDFLLQVYQLVEERGRTMQYWGDIILEHPELIPELPKNAVALEWGYEFDHPFAANCEKFAESEIPFYVCPGTSSWNTLSGRTENAVGNIASAARNGIAQGAVGLLNTDWGDNGHWQPLSVSYLGLLAGAMASWNSRPDLHKSLARCLSIHAFGDPTGKLGTAYYDLGNIYRVFRKRTHNCTVPWQMLFRGHNPSIMDGLDIAEFEEMETRLSDIANAAMGANPIYSDAEIVKEEFAHVLGMLGLAAAMGKARLADRKPRGMESHVRELKERHERVWLLRNRPGGLSDSSKKLGLEDGG